LICIEKNNPFFFVKMPKKATWELWKRSVRHPRDYLKK